MASCGYFFWCFFVEGRQNARNARPGRTKYLYDCRPPSALHNHLRSCLLLSGKSSFYSHCWSAWLLSSALPPSPPPPSPFSNIVWPVHDIGMATCHVCLKCWNAIRVYDPCTLTSCHAVLHTVLFVFWFLKSSGWFRFSFVFCLVLCLVLNTGLFK